MGYYSALFLITVFAIVMRFGVGVPYTDTFVVIILLLLLTERTK